jgi:hypothetical protein
LERFTLPAPSELFAGAWRLLARIWTKEGCRIDPHGGCLPESTVVPSSDEGCGIDPHGVCIGTATSTSDNGCGIDPHGGCIGG